MLGSGTFHGDMTGPSTGQAEGKRAEVSHKVETHSISGLLALLSCPSSRVSDVLGDRAGRQFATVNTPNWDVPRISSVLSGMVDVFLEHAGEHPLQSIAPKYIEATANLVTRVQQKFDILNASPVAAWRRGGALCSFGFLDALRVIQSVFAISPDSLMIGDSMLKVRLWCHECVNELEARFLGSNEDVSIFREIIVETCQEFLLNKISTDEGKRGKAEGDMNLMMLESSGYSWPKSFSRSIGLIASQEEAESIRPLLFSSVVNATETEYRECQGWHQIEQKVSVALEQETRHGKKRAAQVLEDELEENNPHKGARANESDIYHVLPQEPLLAAVSSLVVHSRDH